MRLIPVDGKRRDWPRLVANAVNRLLAVGVDALKAAFESYRDSATGWATYAHTGADQVLVADTRVTLTNNAGSKIESQMPADIVALYDGSVVTGREGDGLAIGIEFVFTPSDGTASYLDVEIDIGGSVGALYPKANEVTRGSGIAHGISYNVNAYTLNTWEANGGTVKVVSDGPGTITEVRYVLHRLHKAR